MPTDTTAFGWKRAARLVEPSVSAESTIAGAALTILLTGLEVCLQGPDAPLVGARVAALVAELDTTGEVTGLVMRHTVRGFSRVQHGGSVSVVVIAGARATVLAPTPDADGGWDAEFVLPVPPSPTSGYSVTVVVSCARSAVDA